MPTRQQLMSEAADWLARLDSGSADLNAFNAWRDADPRRASAFVQVANAAHALDRAKPILKAPAAVAKTNRRGLVFTGLSIGAVVALTSASVAFWRPGRSEATTRVGQKRVAILPNGARLEINTDSQVEWSARNLPVELRLKRGEIALSVQGSNERCILRFDHGAVEVAAGRINARLRGDIIDLTVLAGQATVTATKGGDAPGATPAFVLRPNQAMLLSGSRNAVRTVDTQDAQFISGWPQGELVFEGQTLETAVGEYNRYLVHKIIIADPSLASLKLGGRFSSGDPSVFLGALSSSFGIKVATDASGTSVLTK